MRNLIDPRSVLCIFAVDFLMRRCITLTLSSEFRHTLAANSDWNVDAQFGAVLTIFAADFLMHRCKCSAKS